MGKVFMGFALVLLCASANAPLLGVNVVEEAHRQKEAEWERMVKAICQVESGCDDNARNGKSSAAGRFQMLKIYVDEVNRLCGKKDYSYNDRFNPVKAREMFDIYQGYYNPEKDIEKAITLHRGKKSKGYMDEVRKEMEDME